MYDYIYMCVCRCIYTPFEVYGCILIVGSYPGPCSVQNPCLYRVQICHYLDPKVHKPMAFWHLGSF